MRIIKAVVVLVIGIFCLSILPVPRTSDIGAPRLVSIDELGEMCPPEPAPAEESNLFSAFQEPSSPPSFSGWPGGYHSTASSEYPG